MADDEFFRLRCAVAELPHLSVDVTQVESGVHGRGGDMSKPLDLSRRSNPADTARRELLVDAEQRRRLGADFLASSPTSSLPSSSLPTSPSSSAGASPRILSPEQGQRVPGSRRSSGRSPKRRWRQVSAEDEDEGLVLVQATSMSLPSSTPLTPSTPVSSMSAMSLSSPSRPPSVPLTPAPVMVTDAAAGGSLAGLASPTTRIGRFLRPTGSSAVVRTIDVETRGDPVARPTTTPPQLCVNDPDHAVLLSSPSVLTGYHNGAAAPGATLVRPSKKSRRGSLDAVMGNAHRDEAAAEFFNPLHVPGPACPPPATPDVALASIHFDEYEYGAFVGQGSLGIVQTVTHKRTGKQFALKVMPKHVIVSRNQIDHVQNEKNILSSVQHPGIIQIFGSCQTKTHLYFLLEHVPCGELFAYLHACQRFDQATAAYYAAEVVLALEYLHTRHIAYRDLKPENLLLDNDGHIKLVDFGFAKYIPCDQTRTFCGTPEYIAPEVIRSNGHGKAVDWWALGILVYEMLAGAPPFQESPGHTGGHDAQMFSRIVAGDVRIPSHFSPEAADLVSGLLCTDPALRLGAGADGIRRLKEHHFFRTVDWLALQSRSLSAPIVPVRNAGCSDILAPEEVKLHPSVIKMHQAMDLFAGFEQQDTDGDGGDGDGDVQVEQELQLTQTKPAQQCFASDDEDDINDDDDDDNEEDDE